MLSADFSAEILQAEGSGMISLKWWNRKIYNQEYPARLSFDFNGEIKNFTENPNLREFSTIKPALQEMLKNFSRKGEKKRP